MKPIQSDHSMAGRVRLAATVTSVIVILACALVEIPVRAAEIDAHLAVLQPLIGKTWQGTLKSPDGQHESTVIREFQLLEGGHVVKMTKVNRDMGGHGEGFVYWDDVRKAIGFFFVEDSGVQEAGTVTGEGNLITFEGRMSWPTPPPGPGIRQSYEIRNTFELLSGTSMRDSWFQNAFGPWRPGHVIEFSASGTQSPWQTMTGIAPGPNRVGLRLVEMDERRASGMRKIRAWLWYPAAEGTSRRGSAPVTLDRYLEASAEDFAAKGELSADKVRSLLEEILVTHGVEKERLRERLETPMLATENAAPGPGPYPLVIIGQGYMYEVPIAQAILSEYLASHGFVVATSALLGSRKAQVQLSVEDFSTQIADLDLLLRRVPDLLPVDRTRIGAGGFDLGGMAALVLQMRESSIRALVSLDSGLIFPHNMKLLEATPGFHGPGLTVPTLQVTRDEPGNGRIGVGEDFRYFEDATTPDLYLLRVRGMRHPDLTSFLWYGTKPVDLPFWGPEVGSPRRFQASVFDTVLDFLRAFVADDAGSRHSLDARLESDSASASGDLVLTRGRAVGREPRSGWVPRWPSDLRGPWLGQPLPRSTPGIFAEGILSLGNHEHHLAVAPDGGEMLWVIADKYRTRHTIVRVVEAGGAWNPPQVAPFSGRFNDFAPSFIPDGSGLLFCSNRPLPGSDEASDVNIWRVDRTASGWGSPYPLPPPVNDGTAEYNPSITRDGLLVFQDHDEGGADLYSSRLVDGAWTVPEKIGGGVNTPGPEITPFVSGDGSMLLFASDRPGGLGALDIWVSRRLSNGGWSAPENPGESVNTPASDAVPTLSPDGSVLFFTSFAGYGPSSLRDRTYAELVRMFRSARNGDGTLYWVSNKGLLTPSGQPKGDGTP